MRTPARGSIAYRGKNGLNVVAYSMAGVLLKAQIVREALRGIGQAVERLSRPTSVMQVVDPGTAHVNPDPNQLPDGIYATYALGINDHDRAGVPPRLWPEVIEVSEALLGAAFVVAQEHLGNATTAQVHHDIDHLANYWKHRGEWGGQWQSAHRHTLAGIKALNGGSVPSSSPVAVGMLSELAAKALKQPFTTEALWAAIADLP
jgi:hypothetical protein